MESKLHDFSHQNLMADVPSSDDYNELFDCDEQPNFIHEICELPERVSKALDIKPDIDAIQSMVDDALYDKIEKLIICDIDSTPAQKAEEMRKMIDHRTETYQKCNEIVNSSRENKSKAIAVVITTAVEGALGFVGLWLYWKKRH